MERPPESLKSFANHMATLAQSEGAAPLIRLLQLSGFLGGSSNNHAGNSAINDITALAEANDLRMPPANPEHIGIWERKIENGKTCFVRRLEMMHEWHFWANLGRIEAKGTKRRVVLIGESVARGYLYDPEFTPALALEMMLKPQFGEDQIEVIDLARTNLSYKVTNLAIAALQLEPDLVIIFAGNNWNIDEPRPSEIVEINEALSKDGIAGLKRASEAQIARNARRIVRDVASAYEGQGVPLVWMIPEFNLGDWRDPVTNAPHLGEGLNREWLILLEEAQSALREGELRRARELAQRMVEIDQGVCVAGLYILAECSQRSQDLDGERKYLELARDAMSWDLSRMPVPRAHSVTQMTLREEVSKYRNQIVDLPVIFKEYLNGEIPGRRLIIDYCHLTTEGIQVAMGAAATCVLRALKGVEVPWYALVSDHIAPPREIEAEALFLAAIHNAHWFQSYDLARHYCSRALSLSPHVADLMLNYMELQTRPLVPDLMSGSEEHISRLGSSLMHQYLLTKNEKRLDKVLLDAIVDALAAVGIQAREQLDRLRREEHSVTLSERNLLDYYYCSAVNQPQELAWLLEPAHRKYQPNNPAYYRAYWPESRFIFVGEAGCPVRLCLACRLPPPAPLTASVFIELNEQPLVEMFINGEWSAWEIRLPGEGVHDGLNEISVRWPIPEFPSSKALEKARSNLFERELAEFYPIFGEIHSFTASDGRKLLSSVPAVQPELLTAEVS